MKSEQSLVKGNVISVLLTFAVPFLVANLLQAFYGAVDLVVVGQFGDSAQVSAVATGSQFSAYSCYLFCKSYGRCNNV